MILWWRLYFSNFWLSVMIENQSQNDRLQINKNFFQKFHDDVLDSDRQRVVDGQTVTMRIIGVGVGGKEYLIPSYDPNTRRILSDQDAIEKYAPLIETGEIIGYDSPEAAEADRLIFYPQIVGEE